MSALLNVCGLFVVFCVAFFCLVVVVFCVLVCMFVLFCITTISDDHRALYFSWCHFVCIERQESLEGCFIRSSGSIGSSDLQ